VKGWYGISKDGWPRNGARPVIFYPRGGTCRQPWVKGLTIMVNTIYNGWRYEDVWLDK
jgi:peptide/nickel transport system substrate-binding protein